MTSNSLASVVRTSPIRAARVERKHTPSAGAPNATRRRGRATAALALAACLAWTPTAWAQILRWDNGQVIPGTEGITAGPGVQLDQWNTDAHNLRFANFAGSPDLNQANFYASWLDNARFTGANLAGARLEAPPLAGTDLSGTVVKGASLADITSRGFTQDQFKSTASYQAKDLQGVRLWGNDMTGWDLSGQNLGEAATGDRWSQQVAGAVLNNANLSGANLTGADLSSSKLTNANLGGANLSGAACSDTDLPSPHSSTRTWRERFYTMDRWPTRICREPT